MGELWQAYGNWILYAVIVLAMVWMHGGLGRRGGHGGAHGHDQGHTHGNPQDPPHAAEVSSAAPAAQEDGKGHRHGKGCC